jgi:hypothetical protein
MSTPVRRSPLSAISADTWAVLLSLAVALAVRFGLIPSVSW